MESSASLWLVICIKPMSSAYVVTSAQKIYNHDLSCNPIYTPCWLIYIYIYVYIYIYIFISMSVSMYAEFLIIFNAYAV